MANKNSTPVEIFRDWFNNYITTQVMAEHYGVSVKWLTIQIEKGRRVHNSQARMENVRYS